MQHQRVNIFTFPHKGLRNGLSQLLIKLGHADATNAEHIREIRAQAHEVIHLLHLHQEAEDSCVMQPLSQRAADTVVNCHKEHHALQQHINAIEQQIVALDVKDSPNVLAELYSDVARFFADYLKHMDNEETELNAAIWAHFDDSEILGWQEQIMAKLSLDDQLQWFKYIIPSLNAMERQILLSGVKANAPEGVFEHIIASLKHYLSANEIASLH